jgi:hypothetical protein
MARAEGTESKLAGRVTKVDASLGLVFGYGIVCYERAEKNAKHEPYFDLQDEHVPESLMLKATYLFGKRGAQLDAMHNGVRIGKVEFSFPLTREIAKSMGIHDADRYGWMVGVRPEKPEYLAKFKSQNGKPPEWTGFSIGGWSTSKAYEEGTCPECGAKMGAGNCEHQPKEGE